jgi:hypothetical protein
MEPTKPTATRSYRISLAVLRQAECDHRETFPFDCSYKRHMLEAIYEELFQRFAGYIGATLLIVSFAYGAVTGSSQKADDFYIRAVTFLISPIVNAKEHEAQELMKRIEQIPTKASSALPQTSSI